MDFGVEPEEYRVGEWAATILFPEITGYVPTLVAGEIINVENVYEKNSEPGNAPVSVYVTLRLHDDKISQIIITRDSQYLNRFKESAIGDTSGYV